MPRGAEYADAPPASDNAIESGDNKIAGAEVWMTGSFRAMIDADNACDF